MTGMVLKDFYVLRKTILYYLGFTVLYGVLTAGGVMPYSVLAGIVPLVGMMLPMSSFAYDGQAKWDKFAACTPAGRRGTVQGKYLFALLATFCSSAAVGAVLMALSLLGVVETEAWWEPLAVVGATGCVTLLLDSICMPFLLKYGAEKVRMLSILVFAAVFGLMGILAAMAEHGLTLPPVPPVVVTILPALLAAGTAASLGVSYAASLRVYGKKEL